MKALIIYDSVTSALRANGLLRNATRSTNTKVNWEIGLWRANMLKFPSVAREASVEALDADLIVFAGLQASSLPGWLEEWLEDWAVRRQAQDAALALIKDPDPARPALTAAELRKFATRHKLSFIASDLRRIQAPRLPENSDYSRWQSASRPSSEQGPTP